MNAHDRILKWCRQGPNKHDRYPFVVGQAGMRDGGPRGTCRVVDLTRTNGGETIYYAEGTTWDECLTELRAKGAEL